ncbi:MAG: cation:proton antiporter [Saprospiraceae bacterium]|nr:cation:proton antiporter [Saprospiraceae bacterium]
MQSLSAYTLLFIFCGLIILSYLFSVLNRATRIPSVLLLLGTGILLRYLADLTGFVFEPPPNLIEVIGTVGLIMIVLEAGLDLEVNRAKLPLIRNSFFSALVIFILSTMGVAGLLIWHLPQAPVINCIIYAIPLSIVSSAIVLPSVHHLGHDKKEFLIYEASFSDILGIMVFNFLTAKQLITWQDTLWFFGSIPVGILMSVLVCFVLMFLLLKNRVDIKFFLAFAVLIVIYVGGKLLNLPSLLTILLFGLVVNNWELFRWKPLHRYFTVEDVGEVRRFLKSITAESSFLIRTFFFILFGFGINLVFLQEPAVLMIGSAIVGALVVLRYIYLRVMHRYDLFPELFYIPRGLVTVLLFYKIPEWQRIDQFDEGILFFVILVTSIFMMLGTILYRDRPHTLAEMERDFEAEAEESAA